MGTEIVEDGQLPYLPIPVDAQVEFDEIVDRAVGVVRTVIEELRQKMA